MYYMLACCLLENRRVDQNAAAAPCSAVCASRCYRALRASPVSRACTHITTSLHVNLLSLRARSKTRNSASLRTRATADTPIAARTSDVTPRGEQDPLARPLDWTHQSQHEHRAHGASSRVPGPSATASRPAPSRMGIWLPTAHTMLVTGQISAHFNTIAEPPFPRRRRNGTRTTCTPPSMGCLAGCWARPSSDLLLLCSRLVRAQSSCEWWAASSYDAGRAVRA